MESRSCPRKKCDVDMRPLCHEALDRMETFAREDDRAGIDIRLSSPDHFLPSYEISDCRECRSVFWTLLWPVVHAYETKRENPNRHIHKTYW